MSTDLVKVEAMPVSCMADLTTAGALLADSGMFGITKPSDGFVIAATCHQQGMSLLEFRETYHIIHGTPSMRTDTMLARLTDNGGEFELVTRDSDCAAIKVACGKASGTFELTWEQAKQEPFVYGGKLSEGAIVAMLGRGETPPLKDKYATPRSRMQMLWARVVSDAVRAVCPQACKGTYTPEEVGDFAGPVRDAAPQVVTPAEAVERATVVEAEASEWMTMDSLQITEATTDDLREYYPVSDNETQVAILAEVERRKTTGEKV